MCPYTRSSTIHHGHRLSVEWPTSSKGRSGLCCSVDCSENAPTAWAPRVNLGGMSPLVHAFMEEPAEPDSFRRYV
jgi:hypothetical protein